MLALLLAIAVGEAPVPAPTALDAERAFAADARTLGQWTAFRKWAAPDATMFVPQPISAQAWLKDRKDPAKAIEWWPTASYVSCDGSLAVNTGGWKTADGSVGYFSTVWRREQDGSWKWIVDGGDSLKVARAHPTDVKIVRGTCTGMHVSHGPSGPDSGHGEAADGSLLWTWAVNSDGSRAFVASVKIGTRDTLVIDDKIAPPK